MNARTHDSVSPRTLAALIAATFCIASGSAAVGAPLYHLTPLTVPGASSVSVEDINDAGQAVGTYSSQDFVRHAVLWDATGWHELALPPGDEVNGIAYAINNNGQIVGTADDFVVPTVGMLWDAAAPNQFVTMNGDSDAGVRPADINDAGVVVGGFDVPSRAFVWTAEDGLVDYGIPDPTVEDQQARWSAINADGTIVGVWNQHVSNIHATIGTAGTPVVLPMSDETEAFPTSAVGLNSAGIAVGLGLAEATPDLVPVIFAADGTYSEIAGATLAQDNGSAIAINEAGVIVGTAGIGTANGPVPGMQAWVYRDGVVFDLYDVVDDTSGFARFSNAVAVNASGVIVGTGHDADDTVASFMLTPIAPDAIFANGFEP